VRGGGLGFTGSRAGEAEKRSGADGACSLDRLGGACPPRVAPPVECTNGARRCRAKRRRCFAATAHRQDGDTATHASRLLRGSERVDGSGPPRWKLGEERAGGGTAGPGRPHPVDRVLEGCYLNDRLGVAPNPSPRPSCLRARPRSGGFTTTRRRTVAAPRRPRHRWAPPCGRAEISSEATRRRYERAAVMLLLGPFFGQPTSLPHLPRSTPLPWVR